MIARQSIIMDPDRLVIRPIGHEIGGVTIDGEVVDGDAFGVIFGSRGGQHQCPGREAGGSVQSLRLYSVRFYGSPFYKSQSARTVSRCRLPSDTDECPFSVEIANDE